MKYFKSNPVLCLIRNRSSIDRSYIPGTTRYFDLSHNSENYQTETQLNHLLTYQFLKIDEQSMYRSALISRPVY